MLRNADRQRSGVYRHQHSIAKLKVKVKFALVQATKAQRRSRGIALFFL